MPGMSRRRIIGLRSYQIFSGTLFDPISLAWQILETPVYLTNLVRYWRAQSTAHPSFRICVRYLFPAPGDRHASAGIASGHYFHQDIWAAREIFRRNPRRHVDVGSSVAGFIAHLLCFREVEYVDLRPLRTNVQGLHFRQGDITNLPHATTNWSRCQGAHRTWALWRSDPDGWLKAIAELRRVFRPQVASCTIQYRSARSDWNSMDTASSVLRQSWKPFILSNSRAFHSSIIEANMSAMPSMRSSTDGMMRIVHIY